MTRVLVVDDEAPIRDLVAELFLEEGYEVDRARNGAEALAQALEVHPDVVVTDLMMPVLDGWEFISRLRQEPALAETPVLVMSAAPAQFEQAPRHGVRACMAKPFDMDVLAGAVERLVRPAA